MNLILKPKDLNKLVQQTTTVQLLVLVRSLRKVRNGPKWSIVVCRTSLVRSVGFRVRSVVVCSGVWNNFGEVRRF